MKVYVAQLNPTIGDLEENTKKIISHIISARAKKVDIVLFPEMAICGYPPEDLALYPTFIEEIQRKLQEIVVVSEDIMVVVGLIRKNPSSKGKFLYNSAAVVMDQKLVGFKDKTLLPTYDVFNERRYFEPGSKQKVWEYKHHKIGILICEDVWQHGKGVEYMSYTRDPVIEIQKLHPDILLNLSASPYHIEKKTLRIKIFSQTAITLKCPFILCNQVGGNDSLIFDGYSLCINEKGNLCYLAKGFTEDVAVIDTKKVKNKVVLEDHPIEDLYNALLLGLRDYFVKQGFTRACLGLSGGIDSAVVACLAADALGKENVTCISMPTRFSSFSGMEDAKQLATNLQVEFLEIPIDHLFQNFLDALSPILVQAPENTTEENIQARIRGLILMAFSNKLGHIVLSTGNKSEMALGYCTLYGDMCGGLGVISDLSKTHVYKLASFLNKNKKKIPDSIIQKAPSAELKAGQIDEESLPPYDLLDKILPAYIERHESLEQIAKKYQLDRNFVVDFARKIYLAEYKRRQGPLGLRVTKKAFSKGRMFPIVHKWL